jgi:hypothetical protein
MNVDLFTQLLETYGANLDRWPEEQRSAAEELLKSSIEARSKQRAAQHFEELFRLDRADPDTARMRMVMSSAMRRIRSERREAMSWHWLFSPTVAAVFAAMLLMGCFLGVRTPAVPADPGARPAETALNALLGYSHDDMGGFIE